MNMFHGQKLAMRISPDPFSYLNIISEKQSVS